jgi:antitoxin component of RelBE/YafQ-DinJ toxin-antitoxin module
MVDNSRLTAIQKIGRMYGMEKKKFTVRVREDALQAAKAYAKEHDMTLTDLVDAFFRSIQRVSEINTDTPILQKLAGSLRPDASLEAYYAHLEKKYLGGSRPDGE